MIMLKMIRSFMVVAVKAVGAVALATTILWQVAAHSGSPNGIAYVHVSAFGVDVQVDDASYPIKTHWDTPLVCELRPGKHVLRMIRNGNTLYEEEFTLHSGEEVVVTAWKRPESVRTSASSP
jgi:hypothetical protein